MTNTLLQWVKCGIWPISLAISVDRSFLEISMKSMTNISVLHAQEIHANVLDAEIQLRENTFGPRLEKICIHIASFATAVANVVN